MKSALPGFAKFLFVAFCLSFAAFQLYNYIVAAVETEVAEYVTVEKTERAEGFFVRNEKLIISQKGGEAYFTVEDGARVKKGTKLAEMYLTGNGAEKRRQADETEIQIEGLKAVRASVGNFDIDTAKTDKEIREKIFALLKEQQQADAISVKSMRTQLEALTAKRNVILGGTNAIDAEIAKLEAELAKLKAETNAADETLYSDSTGYFVGAADGFETLLSPKNSLSMTVEDFKNLQQLAVGIEPTAGAVGKIIPDFEWYFITALTVEQAEGVTAGNTIKIRFPFVSDREMTVNVESVSATSDGMRMVVFKSGEFYTELNHLRCQTVELVKEKYSGLKVSESAVKLVDGETGVYVRIGDEVKFRKITTVFKKDSYFVVSTKNEETGYIKPYDEVIVKGVDLHDGKIIKT